MRRLASLIVGSVLLVTLAAAPALGARSAGGAWPDLGGTTSEAGASACDLMVYVPATQVASDGPATVRVWLFQRGVTGGCTATRFCPRDAVTREQMASFLTRIMEHFGHVAPVTSTDFFLDDNLSMHEAAINRLAAAGLTDGCAPHRFCPKQLVTRAQLASFLARLLGTTRLPTTHLDFFVDDEGSVHEGAINRLASAGLTAGCRADVRWFCPTAHVTREQMARFIDVATRP